MGKRLEKEWLVKEKRLVRNGVRGRGLWERGGSRKSEKRREVD